METNNWVGLRKIEVTNKERGQLGPWAPDLWVPESLGPWAPGTLGPHVNAEEAPSHHQPLHHRGPRQQGLLGPWVPGSLGPGPLGPWTRNGPRGPRALGPIIMLRRHLHTTNFLKTNELGLAPSPSKCFTTCVLIFVYYNDVNCLCDILLSYYMRYALPRV